MTKSLSILLLVGGNVLSGLSLTVWWQWFVAGQTGAFPRLPALTVPQALGVSLIVTYMTMDTGVARENKPIEERAMASVIFLGLVWLIAIAYHAFQ